MSKENTINLQFEIGHGPVSVKITRSHGGESGLVAGLDFKSSCGLPEGRLGGFDSHAPPPFSFQWITVFPSPDSSCTNSLELASKWPFCAQTVLKLLDMFSEAGEGVSIGDGQTSSQSRHRLRPTWTIFIVKAVSSMRGLVKTG